MGAETTALYWQLVDIVWILLYPLIYLAGRP
jgi:cytochrome c oxidase subunit 3